MVQHEIDVINMIHRYDSLVNNHQSEMISCMPKVTCDGSWPFPVRYTGFPLFFASTIIFQVRNLKARVVLKLGFLVSV